MGPRLLGNEIATFDSIFKMADGLGKGRVTFLPAIRGSRTNIHKNDKGLMLRRFDSSLPNIDFARTDVHKVSTLVANKQTRKQISEWFNSWRPWQKRILLCNMTEICSKEQLKALITILEPVFHRDFIVRLRGMYPVVQPRIVHRYPNYAVCELQNSEQNLIGHKASGLELNKLEDILRDSGNSEEIKWEIEEEKTVKTTLELDNRENQEILSQTETQSGTCYQEQKQVPPSLSSVGKTVPLFFSVATAVEIPSPHRHEHAPQFCKNVSIHNFFGPSGAELKKLGNMRTKHRPGDIDKVYGSAPVTFKHAKWWEEYRGEKLVRARRSKLSKYFKSQLSQIEKWLDDWQSYERVEALSEVVKCCDPDILDFLSHCLIQRLRDQTDLNCVPDHILLKVFSLLDVQSLCRSSQVCRRWRYLTSSSDIWKDKIETMGSDEGVDYLARKIECLGRDQLIDWKQAFREVRHFYKDFQNVKLLEQEEAEQMTKGKKDPAKSKYSKDYLMFPRCHTDSTVSPPRVPSGVVELTLGTSVEDFGPAQSATTSDQRENRKDFETREGDSNELTGGNLKMLNKSLKALTEGGRAKGEDEQDEEVAMDIRPAMIQASNLLDGKTSPKRFRYMTFAVQDVRHLKKVRRLQGHMDAVLCLQFDKRRIISGSADRTVRVWDVRSGRSIRKMRGHKGGVRCLQYNEELIFSGSWDMTIAVWHIVKFERLRVLYGHTGCVSCLSFDDNHLVSGSHDCTVRIWCMAAWECVGVIDAHEAAVTCLAFDGANIVTGSADRTLKLWDMKTRQCLKQFEGHEDAVQTVKVVGSLIISGAVDGTIVFWDIVTTQCEAAIQAHEGPVHWLDCDEDHFFTAGGDNLVKEWDMGTCTCLRTLQGHKGPVLCLQAESHRIVSCSADGALRIWDLVPDYDDFANQISRSEVGIEDNTIEVMTVRPQQKP